MTDIVFDVSLFIEDRKANKKPIPERIIGRRTVISIKDLLPILFINSLVVIIEKCSILIIFNRVYKYFICTRNYFFEMNNFCILIQNL